MQIVFATTADGRAYPEHPGGEAGCVDGAVVGPAGLLDILATRLGLGGPKVPPVVRIATWQRKLEVAAAEAPRFWAASLASDGWATARQLLSWRDALVEAGWSPPRLVAPQHQVAPRQPAARLQGHLPSDIEQGLVPMASFQAGALGRNEGSQERQRPNPTRPGYGCEQHQAHPAQAAGLDGAGAGRTHRITVDPLGLNTTAPAPLDRVVERQHRGAVSDEDLDEQPKQDAGC